MAPVGFASLSGGDIPDREVRSLFVVLPTPEVQLLESFKPVWVHALTGQLAVERLDEDIVCRLTGPREVQRQATLVSP